MGKRESKTHFRVQRRQDGPIFALCGRREIDWHTANVENVNCGACLKIVRESSLVFVPKGPREEARIG